MKNKSKKAPNKETTTVHKYKRLLKEYKRINALKWLYLLPIAACIVFTLGITESKQKYMDVTHSRRPFVRMHVADSLRIEAKDTTIYYTAKPNMLAAVYVRDVKSDYRRPDKYDGKEIMRHYDNLSA
jgi:hypothetical protein